MQVSKDAHKSLRKVWELCDCSECCFTSQPQNYSISFNISLEKKYQRRRTAMLTLNAFYSPLALEYRSSKYIKFYGLTMLLNWNAWHTVQHKKVSVTWPVWCYFKVLCMRLQRHRATEALSSSRFPAFQRSIVRLLRARNGCRHVKMPTCEDARRCKRLTFDSALVPERQIRQKTSYVRLIRIEVTQEMINMLIQCNATVIRRWKRAVINYEICSLEGQLHYNHFYQSSFIQCRLRAQEKPNEPCIRVNM